MDSPHVHKMWDEHELSKLSGTTNPFPLLCDSCANLGKQYGVFNEDRGGNIRGSFIIDPEGIVQNIEIVAAPVGRNFDETLRLITAHQFVAENNGTKAAPCSWTPGKMHLEPSPDKVGKVWESLKK